MPNFFTSLLWLMHTEMVEHCLCSVAAAQWDQKDATIEDLDEMGIAWFAGGPLDA